jgi:glycosyltransferase involved in cell wall biosynthesis
MDMEKKYKYDITIGMPVYGVEKYVRKCILSVLNQCADCKIEVLVIDDCGTDHSIDIIRECQISHPNGNFIRIIRQPQNMGCWAARNTILDEAKGKYLLYIDGDDYLSPDAVEKLYHAAEEQQVEAVYGSVVSVDELGNPVVFSIGDMKLPYKVLIGKDQLANYANQSVRPTLYNFIWNVLLRTDFLREKQLRFKETRFADDIIFETDMQPLITKAVLLPDETYYYVLRDGSLSNYHNREYIELKEIEQYIWVYSYLKEQTKELKDKPYYETRCAKVMKHMFHIVCGAIKNQKKIHPALTNRIIKDAMEHPVGILQLLKFKRYKLVNIGFWVIGEAPPVLSVWIIKAIGKWKHLI